MSTPFSKRKKRGQEPTPVPKNSLGGRIRSARDRLGLSTRALGKMVGVSNVTITHIETGQTDPPFKTLRVLAQELQDDFGLRELARYAKQLVDIPVVAYVAGGRPIVEDIEDEFVKIDPELVRLSAGVCGLKVKGDSMLGEHILSKDTLICRRVSDPKSLRKGTIVVVDLKGERGAAVKRWEFKNGMIYLYADKYARDDEKQSFHDWEVGKVFEILALVRDFKQTSQK